MRSYPDDKNVILRGQRVSALAGKFRRAYGIRGPVASALEKTVRDFEAFHGIVIAVGLGVALWAVIAIGVLN